MNAEITAVQKLTLRDLQADFQLDSVTVILEDFELGKGKIIIECYGDSWSACWGAMGGKNVATFFCSCDEHYIAKKLSGISGDVPDYEALEAEGKKEVCRLRRNRDLTESEARDLFGDAERFSNAESACDLDGSAMQIIFGEEWWHSIPNRPNPAYQYLCRIIKAVQVGMQVSGLTGHPAEEQAA
jgi:hypothetical protein